MRKIATSATKGQGKAPKAINFEGVTIYTASTCMVLYVDRTEQRSGFVGSHVGWLVWRAGVFAIRQNPILRNPYFAESWSEQWLVRFNTEKGKVVKLGAVDNGQQAISYTTIINKWMELLCCDNEKSVDK